MEWQDSGIILKLSPHGEGKAIVSIFTQDHGRHLGYIRGISKKNAFLQPGSLVRCRWQSRLEDQLGSWTIEPQQSFYSHVMNAPDRLAALMSACAWAEATLPERECHRDLFENFYDCLQALAREDGLSAYLNFEMRLLKELGFGLDLDHCAVCGGNHDLNYISPRTGRAVCAQDAKPYLDKILDNPTFFKRQDIIPKIKDIVDGLELTRYFLERFILTQLNKAMPQARLRLMTILRKQANG